MRRIGLIRVLTTDDEALLRLHGKRIMEYFPAFEVVSACIPDQPNGVHDDETEALAVPKVIALGKQMQQEGAEAVIVSCAGDPGVTGLAEVLTIPVIGAGRAAASMARALTLPVGVLGLTQKVPAAIREILGEYLVADIVPDGVSSTLDLMTESGYAATVSAAHVLKQKGAKAIVLACTGMSTIGIAPKLAAELAMPVIDPVRAEAALTWSVLGGGISK